MIDDPVEVGVGFDLVSTAAGFRAGDLLDRLHVHCVDDTVAIGITSEEDLKDESSPGSSFAADGNRVLSDRERVERDAVCAAVADVIALVNGSDCVAKSIGDMDRRGIERASICRQDVKAENRSGPSGREIIRSDRDGDRDLLLRGCHHPLEGGEDVAWKRQQGPILERLHRRRVTVLDVLTPVANGGLHRPAPWCVWWIGAALTQRAACPGRTRRGGDSSDQRPIASMDA